MRKLNTIVAVICILLLATMFLVGCTNQASQSTASQSQSQQPSMQSGSAPVDQAQPSADVAPQDQAASDLNVTSTDPTTEVDTSQMPEPAADSQ